jgi:hypothetical protein
MFSNKKNIPIFMRGFVHITSGMSNSLHVELEIIESVLCKISFD